MKKEVKYTHDNFSVFCGKRTIAKSYIGMKSAKIEVRILQGMNRTETIKKICEDCPEFAERTGIDENYYPRLFA